jgi:hypothetical protein
LRGCGESTSLSVNDRSRGPNGMNQPRERKMSQFNNDDLRALIEYDKEVWFNFLLYLHNKELLNVKKTILYSILFLISILIVFRVVPFVIGLVVIPIILFFVDRESLLMVDYGLLGTFFFFFIFAGNLARLDAVNNVISELLQKDTLLVSIFSCQFISNVPSAILLSRFTTDYAPLLLGVNIGGTGTLIASLASLITFSEFRILHPEHTKKYLLIFGAVNVAFLVIMTVTAKLFLAV